jgi:acetyl esterase/lipase
MHAFVLENADRFHADTGKIILAGDSAGSQLSAQMATLITNAGHAQEVGITPALKPEQLKGVVLTCGIYKMEELAYPNPALSKIIGWGDDVTVWAYSGTNDFSDPIIRQMSPYYHVTKGFPSTFITGGNADPLTDVQSKPLADKLQSLGVGVTRLFYEPSHAPALPHEYQFNLDTDDGQKAFQQITAFMHERTQ